MNPKEIALKIALKKVFKDTTFSICDINNCLELTETIPDPNIMKILRSIHCSKYAEMPPEFRNWLFTTVIHMFSANGFNLEDIDNMESFFHKQITITI